MNIEQLQYIVEVARTKSLSAASENLHVTQSAISQAISNMETELNIKLFSRSRHGTLPTAEGKKIIKKAMEIVIKLQEIKEEAQDQWEIQNSELRIVTIPVGMITLVKTVSSLKKDSVKTNFQLSEKRSKDILKEIKENKADLGLIAINKNIKIDDELVFEPIWRGKIVVGVGKDSPLAPKKNILPTELVNYPIVLYNEDYVHEFIDHFTEKFGPINKMFTSNNATAVLGALLEGLAITVGYDFSFINNPFVSNGTLVMLEINQFEQDPLLLGWVRSKDNKVSGISKQFINRFNQAFQVGNL
ncbi:LysR family transcriptional regulator [Neobacillus sp. NRS-1170]|uniref:LysR family transcriptional regulator n=1 Tax=Neobacillus sp. NRS-1170 TaxID=3233898 RepID=UPI003D29DD6F